MSRSGWSAAPAVAAGIAVALGAGDGGAVVVQVDGTVLPAAPTPVETNPAGIRGCLDAYETPIRMSPTFDAAVTPEVFLPNPGSPTLTFRVLAEGAGYRNSFGWYNVGDDVTSPANLRVIFDCRATGGFSCDPAARPGGWPRTVSVTFTAGVGGYRGGYIGFWLRTPERFAGGSDPDGCGSAADTLNRIYFTERSLNDDGNYVHVLVYESRNIPDVFYFGFEDLFRGGDNDFEDMFVRADGLVPPCRPQTEVCDGIDNDCDLAIDESDPQIGLPCDPDPSDGAYDLGICRPGAWACAGARLRCDGGVLPRPEVCDAYDNDCDGETDEADPSLGRPCGTDVGACEFGAYECVRGALECRGATGPAEEVCNRIDDDCDGTTDETFPGLGLPCGIDVGECDPGAWACVAGIEVCVGGTDPTPEICDGLDNDCDGAADDGDPGGGMPCGEDEGECSHGVTACVAGIVTCVGGVGPAPELCDGLDNDCDGLTDEDNPGGGGPCGSETGECTAGTLECIGGRYECVGGSGPWEEECDGLDNDCDGAIDDGDPGGGGTCGEDEGECEPGVLRCIGGRLECVGARGPVPEACDCLDNDCDGATDEEPLDLPCPEPGACIECSCLFPCSGGEFPCPPGKECGPDGYCHEGLCAGVRCEPGEVCRDGACVDPCAGVECPDGHRCVAGFCHEDTCHVFGCRPGEICIEGRCLPDPCTAVTCPTGRFCRLGECVVACGGVECPRGHVCDRDGTCVAD
ncbi:MAG: DUF4114 domain-containing protein, partial [Myxococcota bacterium]|nr:DUF4114 domain-containing protein [Myxococcota bacterium]